MWSLQCLKGTWLHNHVLIDGTLKVTISINMNDQTNRLKWSCLRSICVYIRRIMSGRLGSVSGSGECLVVRFNISRLKSIKESSECNFLSKSTSASMDFCFFAFPWGFLLRISFTSNLATWSSSPSFSLKGELDKLARSKVPLSPELALSSAGAKSRDFLLCSAENSILTWLKHLENKWTITAKEAKNNDKAAKTASLRRFTPRDNSGFHCSRSVKLFINKQ